MKRIVWTDYLRYRASLRGYDLSEIEGTLRFGEERYRDAASGRWIVIGRHHGTLIMIPYEADESEVRPVTIHATTRQQINVRIKSGRFQIE